MVNSANTSVPTMNPSCSAEVSVPTAVAGQPNSRCKSGMTAFTANHNEVPANCASTSTGKMRRGGAVVMAWPTVGGESVRPRAA